MARRQIKIKRIRNATTRQVTFSKRHCGLRKKAHDLAVLCDVEVGLVMLSTKGQLFRFASPRMERYTQNSETRNRSSSSDNAKLNRLSTFTEELKCLQSNLLGQNLELLSLRDLIQLEQHMHTNLIRIRAKKACLPHNVLCFAAESSYLHDAETEFMYLLTGRAK